MPHEPSSPAVGHYSAHIAVDCSLGCLLVGEGVAEVGVDRRTPWFRSLILRRRARDFAVVGTFRRISSLFQNISFYPVMFTLIRTHFTPDTSRLLSRFSTMSLIQPVRLANARVWFSGDVTVIPIDTVVIDGHTGKP